MEAKEEAENVVFPQQIMQVDYKAGRPLWKEPFIYERSKQGTEQQIWSILYSRNNERFFLQNEQLIDRDDFNEIIKSSEEEREEFFKENIPFLLKKIENIINVKYIYNFSFKYDFVDEKNVVHRDNNLDITTIWPKN